MGGFLSSNVSFTTCAVENAKPITPGDLRNGAFTEAIDPDGYRFGWTGLDELLDFDNFFLALSDGRFIGFSYRLDMRKPNMAVVRLKVAEKIRDEELTGGKIGAKRRKEIKEEILEKMRVQCGFAAMLIDCIWDMEKKRFFIASTSTKLVDRVLEHFKRTFGMEATPIWPEKDLAQVFSDIQEAGGIEIEGVFLEPIGTASLRSTPQSEQKQSVAVQNSQDAVAQALTNGMSIDKMAFLARENGTEEEWQFTLNSELLVSGLRFPKPEKGADLDATFLINAERVSKTADIIEKLGLESE